MRMLILIALLLLALPGTAHAAPPANDNRADAQAIPSFPQTLAATTAEATVERLDPQVSRCGRVESTIWYRIDTAPDGLIALTVKGAAGVAPVLRIYRRAASAIQEVDCASAGPGAIIYEQFGITPERVVAAAHSSLSKVGATYGSPTGN